MTMTKHKNNNNTNNATNKQSTSAQLKIDHEYGTKKSDSIHAFPVKFEYCSTNDDISTFISLHKSFLIKIGLAEEHLVSISPKAPFHQQTNIQAFPTSTKEYNKYVDYQITKHRNKKYKITIAHYIITHQPYRAIQSILLPDLQQHKVYLSYNYWHRHKVLDTVNIGWFMNFHSNMGSKSQLKTTIIKEFYSLQFNQHEIHILQETCGVTGQIHLPKFFFNNINIQVSFNNTKTKTKATALQAGRKDIPLLKFLLSKLFMERYDNLTYSLIPLSLRYTNPQAYSQNAEVHNNFLHSFQSISIHSINEFLMYDGKKNLYEQLLQHDDILAVEPTAQTLDIGKWHIHTFKSTAIEVQTHIDAILSTVSKNTTTLPKRLTKFKISDNMIKYMDQIAKTTTHQHHTKQQAAIANLRTNHTKNTKIYQPQISHKKDTKHLKNKKLTPNPTTKKYTTKFTTKSNISATEHPNHTTDNKNKTI